MLNSPKSLAKDLVKPTTPDLAKSGVVGLTRSFARDLGEFNIRVNSVVPGWVLTQRQIDLWLNEESEKDLMKNQCLKARLLPHELMR